MKRTEIRNSILMERKFTWKLSKVDLLVYVADTNLLCIKLWHCYIFIVNKTQ